MIGTKIVEELVQSVALSHRVKGYKRCSLLMLAGPESGKTTIASATKCVHVRPVAVMSGRSIVREIKDRHETEFLLFNDLTAVRAMSASAVGLLIVILNQVTQDERGIVAFAGKEVEEITRPLGIIACLTFRTFSDHRARWKEMGFISRMIPFAYSYDDELVAEIKDAVDLGDHSSRAKPHKGMPKPSRTPIAVKMSGDLTRELRRVSDARAKTLGQLGIRLLQSYHSLIRAHALLKQRREVIREDMDFLRVVDSFVSITACKPLNGHLKALEQTHGKTTTTGRPERPRHPRRRARV
jgi:hypothetical protein